jgi:hypothetical protein
MRFNTTVWWQVAETAVPTGGCWQEWKPKFRGMSETAEAAEREAAEAHREDDVWCKWRPGTLESCRSSCWQLRILEVLREQSKIVSSVSLLERGKVTTRCDHLTGWLPLIGMISLSGCGRCLQCTVTAPKLEKNCNVLLAVNLVNYVTCMLQLCVCASMVILTTLADSQQN